ncbi:MAG: hypothetical protein PHN64_06790 [Desulfovibrionaceae bacterium]|jgi:hypothetical protein|nr:hypothetical protein [Desulfovibrionaceae bacterium]
MWTMLSALASKIATRLLPDKEEQRAAQCALNKQELDNAPVSRLRLWRAFLGWVLTWLFLWEVAGRLIIIPLFFVDLSQHLPPSALDQILTLLMGMLGLGW